jgi:Clp amino terminal domain, pathogenicity island component
MKFRSPIRVESVSYSDDAQRCMGWSTALAAPRRATSVTLLLAILEAGAGTTARRLLVDAGLTTQALEPLEVAARGPERGPRKGLRRLVRLPLGIRQSADYERVVQRAGLQLPVRQGFAQKRRVLTTDDLLLALLMEDGPAKDALVSLGIDPSGLRSELMQSSPTPAEDRDPQA